MMKQRVARRTAPVADMINQHETPLVLWSNKSGSEITGTISPAFLPLKVLTMANMEHPYYTGFLADLHDAYPVIDNHLAIAKNGDALTSWRQQTDIAPPLRQYELIQYDIMFGSKYGMPSFFPSNYSGS